MYLTPSFEATYMSPHLKLKRKKMTIGSFAHGGKKDDNILAGIINISIHFVSDAIFKGYEVIV